MTPQLTDPQAKPLTDDAAPPRPSPEQIDDLIAAYNAALMFLREADEALSEVKQRLILEVDSYGHRPAGAEQSIRLEGRRNLATVTRGTTVSINEEAVYNLKNYLWDNEMLTLFDRFFQRQSKHVLVEGARDVLKTLTLPRRVEEKIAALFGKAFDIKAKSPSLKVELVKAEKPEKKPRGGKKAA